MSTILQLESQFMIETATVKLKFAPPKSVEFGRSFPCFAAADAMEQREKRHPLAAMHVGGNAAAKTDLSGLSFQQVLSNICSSPKETILEKESVYVHPLSKRSSSSRLSEKSFEMCTENLGSETGTDIIDSSILSLSPSIHNSPRVKSSAREYSRNKVNSRNFPPPLTTMSGGNSLQVRPHREGGRLVIKAIETPVKQTYLRAERSHGRLRLCLLKDHASEFDSQETAQENIEVDSDEDEEEVDVVEKNESYINDQELEGGNEEDEDDDDDDDESDAQMSCSKDMDGNNFDFEVEMGLEKFQRLSRCNEGGHGNKGLYNLKRLCVVTT